MRAHGERDFEGQLRRLHLLIGSWLERDPRGRLFFASIVVHRRAGDAFAAPVVFSRSAGEVLRSDLFPGLELPLARIFETTAPPDA